MKFMRRKDLSVDVRIHIAMFALFYQGVYGTITNLAQRYNVSRKFIYQLLWAAQFALAIEFNSLAEPSVSQPDVAVNRMILLLRLEGNCSEQRISNILSASNISPNSIGTISSRLKAYGEKLPCTLTSKTAQFVMYLSDELFTKRQPILVTIEPKSMAILRMELAQTRTASEWKDHWTEIENQQFYTLGLVSDRAKGLVSGFKEMFPELPHGFDLFHDIRGLTTIILIKLEKAAYKAIAYEQDRWKKLDSARSERVINKRIDDYEKAAKAAEQAIELYENAIYLFGCLQPLFDLFDEKGNLRDPQIVQGDMETILDLMSELKCKVLHDEVETFRNNLEGTLLYWKTAQRMYEVLSNQISDVEALKALCLAWQWNHKFYQAKSARQKQHCQQERDFWLAYAQTRLEDTFKFTKELTFELLDNVIRSSSLIETVNSLIRPYLNTCKGQITPEMLNLIMFYHNHRKFNDGKRKKKAPIEILTGKILEQHWVDLLMAA